MVSSQRVKQARPNSPAAQTELVLDAAEVCIQRHGIRKTTMDDIAREVGISRPSIYRFFADREELLAALATRHSRALTDKTQKFLARQPTFADALVEGLLYLADHGRRDPFTRLMVAQDELSFGRKWGFTATATQLTGEFWDPLLDEAEQKGDVRPGLDRHAVHLWLANLGLMLMSMLENNVAEPDELREMVRELVVPAFVDNGARVGTKTARRAPKRAR